MPYDPQKHRRRSIRLPGHDYSLAGVYFVTVCVKGRRRILGEVRSGTVRLSRAGCIVRDWWMRLPDRFSGIEIDAFVVMPDHVHGVVVIGDAPATIPGGGLAGAIHESSLRGLPSGYPSMPDPSNGMASKRRQMLLSKVIGYWKMNSAKEINGLLGRGGPFWQRNYHERILNTVRALRAVRRYIELNPAKWQAQSGDFRKSFWKGDS